MLLVLKACPSFQKTWDEHLKLYEENLLYLAMGDLTRHIIDLYNENKTEEVLTVFDVVEKFHTDGNDYVKELATIGFLESLQNNADKNAKQFVQYLKPVSLKWWNELNKFWKGEVKFVGQSFN